MSISRYAFAVIQAARRFGTILTARVACYLRCTYRFSLRSGHGDGKNGVSRSRIRLRQGARSHSESDWHR